LQACWPGRDIEHLRRPRTGGRCSFRERNVTLGAGGGRARARRHAVPDGRGATGRLCPWRRAQREAGDGQRNSVRQPPPPRQTGPTPAARVLGWLRLCGSGAPGRSSGCARHCLRGKGERGRFQRNAMPQIARSYARKAAASLREGSYDAKRPVHPRVFQAAGARGVTGPQDPRPGVELRFVHRMWLKLHVQSTEAVRACTWGDFQCSPKLGETAAAALAATGLRVHASPGDRFRRCCLPAQGELDAERFRGIRLRTGRERIRRDRCRGTPCPCSNQASAFALLELRAYGAGGPNVLAAAETACASPGQGTRRASNIPARWSGTQE